MNVLSGMGVGVRGCAGGDNESKTIALFPASERLSPKTIRLENGSAPAGPAPTSTQTSGICATARTRHFMSVMCPPYQSLSEYGNNRNRRTSHHRVERGVHPRQVPSEYHPPDCLRRGVPCPLTCRPRR